LKIIGRLPRRGAIAALGGCIAVLAFAGTAQAETFPMGPALSAPTAFEGSCEETCSTATVELGERTAASPVTGTISRWRVKGSTEVPGYELDVVRRNSGGTFTVTASSGPVTSHGAQLETFTTNLPIAAGEYIGLKLPVGGSVAILETPGTEVFFTPPLSLGETRAPEESGGETESSAPFAAGFNADVETIAAPPVIPPPAPEAHCIVPRLKGKKLAAAKKALRAAGCGVGVVKRKHGVKATVGKVVRELPKADRVLPVGTAVSVKLG
jgi:hypothetical protein